MSFEMSEPSNERSGAFIKTALEGFVENFTIVRPLEDNTSREAVSRPEMREVGVFFEDRIKPLFMDAIGRLSFERLLRAPQENRESIIAHEINPSFQKAREQAQALLDATFPKGSVHRQLIDSKELGDGLMSDWLATGLFEKVKSWSDELPS